VLILSMLVNSCRRGPGVDVPHGLIAVADGDAGGALRGNHVAAGEDAGVGRHHRRINLVSRVRRQTMMASSHGASRPRAGMRNQVKPCSALLCCSCDLN
jgi:hypothetical protein